jgi:hypothetical protein
MVGVQPISKDEMCMFLLVEGGSDPQRRRVARLDGACYTNVARPTFLGKLAACECEGVISVKITTVQFTAEMFRSIGIGAD